MSKKPISREQVNKHLKSFAKEKADHVVKKSNTKIAKYYDINEVTVSKKIKVISKNMQDLTVLDVLEETNSSFKENVNDTQSQTQSLTKTNGYYNFCGFLRPHNQGLQ